MASYTTFKSKINKNLEVFLCLLIVLLISGTWSFPASTALGDGKGLRADSGEVEDSSSWFLPTIISISSIVILIVVLFACGTAGGCCGLSKIHWFGRTRQEPVPMSFDNPVLEGGTMMTTLSQIDVRALELNPVVFEPLPTIDDLTPLSNQGANVPSGVSGSGGSGSGGSLRSHNKSLPTVIPFAADDSDLYAHDWFDEQFRNFPRGNLEYVREVGKGWFGQVMEAEAKDIVPFARKIRVLVKVLRGDASQIEQMRFLDESRMYRDANHGNILKLLGHSIEQLPFLLIMEQCPQGDLKSYLISNVTRADMLSTQGTLIRMALDIAKGLEWMSSADFIHHDLAARNCQIASEGRIVVGDYGLGTSLFKDDYYWNSNVPIPLRWAAPETLHCTISTIQTLKVTKFANIWTFAVVLWEIMEFAKLPYFELSDEEVISRVIADKSYCLGSPTLPYIPLKNELYEIMRSCWSTDPLKRPSFSSIVSRLQTLLETIDLQQTSAPDEFESKWEQLGRNSTSSADDDKPRKKSVSFTGIQKELKKAEDKSDSRAEIGRFNSELESFNQSSVVLNQESKLKPKDMIEDQELLPSLDLDEEQWVQRIERGDISQKVLEKSQSVQDLMVLTHVEPSEFGDSDSLPFISKQFEMVSAISEATGDGNQGGLSQSSGTTSSNSFKKSSSDTALSSISSPTNGTSTNSSQDAMCVSSFVIDTPEKSSNLKDKIQEISRLDPGISVTPASPQITNRTGIEVNVLQATPDPGVQINVIQPTPSPLVNCPSITGATNQNQANGSKHEGPTGYNRKVQFKFNSPEHVNGNGTHMQRHTSTPKRSGSSPLPLDGYDDTPEDVFESQTPLNASCPISPIKKKTARGGFLPGETVSSILVGASDDLGLNAYQAVSTQLQESSVNSENYSEGEDEYSVTKTFVQENTLPKRQQNKVSLDSVTKLAAEIPTHSSLEETDAGQRGRGRFNLTPWPGFQESQEEPPQSLSVVAENSGVDTNYKNSDDTTMISSEIEDLGSSDFSKIGTTINSSWDVVNSNSGKDTASWAIVSEGELVVSENASSKEASKSKTADRAFTAVSSNDEDNNESDDFWTKQFQSVQHAANSTRSLFELSLGADEEYKSEGDKFVEDIEAANEELGSLVLHDLEDTNALKQVVPETRDSTASPNQEAKLAFLGDNTDNKGCTSQNLLKEESSVSNSSNITNVQFLSVNNSVEVTKSRRPSFRTLFAGGGNSERNETVEESEGEDEASLCKEFTPSKWNQSLIPARPAIKSPAAETTNATTVQPKSSLKKSVSFERKKPNVIYKYPPPPPASDSEDDERFHFRTSTIKPSTIPISSAASLDWELTQEELEDAEINHEDWGEDEVIPKADPMDVYRISGYENESFHVRGSSEPFVFQPPILGELRHTRDRLKLDLSKGEASLLDEDSAMKGAPPKLDSGVGSSTNVSPFNHCDMLPSKRNNEEDNNNAGTPGEP